jgi:hypothetical protein
VRGSKEATHCLAFLIKDTTPSPLLLHTRVPLQALSLQYSSHRFFTHHFLSFSLCRRRHESFCSSALDEAARLHRRRGSRWRLRQPHPPPPGTAAPRLPSPPTVLLALGGARPRVAPCGWRADEPCAGAAPPPVSGLLAAAGGSSRIATPRRSRWSSSSRTCSVPGRRSVCRRCGRGGGGGGVTPQVFN